MTIARYTPLPHWVLVALIVVFVNPVTSQPIRTQQWVQNVEFKDLGTREVWKASEKEETPQGSQLSQMKTSHYNKPVEKRELSSEESLVSVLVPVAPTSDYLPVGHSHAVTNKQDISVAESKHVVPQRLHHYGEVFSNQEDEIETHLDPETESYVTSTLQISPTHSISFLSYRISFPFLKFAPKCPPRLPLPGIFTTVVLLLSLVWIAIFTIAMVELGNYLWKKRRAARLAMEGDGLLRDGVSSSGEHGKIPLGALTVPGQKAENCVDSVSLMSDSNSDSGSDSEPEVDDYRIF